MSDFGLSHSFNLLRERWIPIVLLDGTAEEVSLLDVLTHSSDIRELSGDIPQEELPLLRLLLAILYRAYFFVPDTDKELVEMWKDIWEQGHFDQDIIEDYLTPLEGRFDLFDAEHPFFQVPGLLFCSKNPDSVGELIADAPKSKKFLFSTRDRNHLDDISYAEAARWLVFFQAYDIAGNKSPVVGNSHVRDGKVNAPKGAEGTGLLGGEGGVFFEGANLFQTLMLNWELFDHQRSKGKLMFGNVCDRAPWEQENTSSDMRFAEPEEPAGPVGIFTWQSRRIRLVCDKKRNRVTGIISCYGDVTTLADKQDVETMTAWRESKSQQKKLGTPYIPLMPLTHDSSQQLWRGLSPLIAARGGEGTSDLRPGIVRWVDMLYEKGVFCTDSPVVALHAQGMEYGTAKSALVDGIDDAFSFPLSMLRYDSLECVRSIEVIEHTDKAVNALADFIINVRKASGCRLTGSKATRKLVQTLKEDARKHAYIELDSIFKDRLAHFKRNVDAVEYCDEWRGEVHRRLLVMAEDYVASSNLSYFTEHDGMSVGKAFSWYKANLNKALGRLATSESAPRPDIQGESDGKKGE